VLRCLTPHGSDKSIVEGNGKTIRSTEYSVQQYYSYKSSHVQQQLVIQPHPAKINPLRAKKKYRSLYVVRTTLEKVSM